MDLDDLAFSGIGEFARQWLLLRRAELIWFYQEGASWLFPDAWDGFLKPIPEVERGDLMSAYYRRLTSEDPAVRSEAAKAWSIWEGTTSKLFVDPAYVAHYAGDEARAGARLRAAVAHGRAVGLASWPLPAPERDWPTAWLTARAILGRAFWRVARLGDPAAWPTLAAGLGWTPGED